MSRYGEFPHFPGLIPHEPSLPQPRRLQALTVEGLIGWTPGRRRRRASRRPRDARSRRRGSRLHALRVPVGLAVWPAGGTAVVECDGCGLRFLWPRLAPHVEHESYYRELYLPQFAPGGEGDAARADVRRAIADIERFVPVGRLLDVGCATGEFLRAAAERGWLGRGETIVAVARR